MKHTMQSAIIIPARWGSTRLPGKPLVNIAGRTLLERVVAIARVAAQASGAQIVVATDDARIAAHCNALNVQAVMTPVECATGTDRVYAAAQQLAVSPEFIINLQGDAPFTPPDFVTALLRHLQHSTADAVTPVVPLDWAALDKLRQTKQTTPHSGTLAVFDSATGRAHWFSKTILPTIRKESVLRQNAPVSPVWRHVGLYGYRRAMLERFVALPEGYYEALEGLEQLRVLEHGYRMDCVPVDYAGRPAMSGVDSPEDVARAEAVIAAHGDPFPC